MGGLAAAPAAATDPAVDVSEDRSVPEAPEIPWIRRYRPRRGLVELGVGAGVLLPSADHELYNYMTPWRPLRPAAADLVLRAGFYPLSFVGIEGEGAVGRAGIVDGGSATILGGRGHLVAQLPLFSVVPFVLVGGGALGVVGGLGRDVDPSLHFGGGVKVLISRWVGVRVDARAHVGPAHTVEADRTFHPELLASLVVTLARPYLDTDGDGVPDPGQKAPREDACPRQAGVVSLLGCPDRDRDGLRDQDDRCPDEAGLAPRDGCPPLRDSDGDGFYDPEQYEIPEGRVDACPGEGGVPEYQGCIAPDSDGDGLDDLHDGCVDAAEVVNGFEDGDGCPDRVPPDLERILGTIRGISFGFLSARITEGSRPAIVDAAKVLAEYPELKLEIQGHTDADGDPEFNRALSRRRAAAVRKALIAEGIAAGRLRAVGYGGERPIASNEDEAGRAKNRRIELRLVGIDGALIELPEGGG
ncbi:MAG: OmpA family protein [Nannocystis sp.]|nr:OmpA family protein [Nannocystis sp.]